MPGGPEAFVLVVQTRGWTVDKPSTQERAGRSGAKALK